MNYGLLSQSHHPLQGQMRGDATSTQFYSLGKAVMDTPSERGAVTIKVGIASLALGPGCVGLGAHTVHQVLQLGQDSFRTREMVEKNCKEMKHILTEVAHSCGHRTSCRHRRRSSSGFKEGLQEERKAGACSEVERVQETVMRLVDHYCPCFHVLGCGSIPLLKDSEDLNTLALHAISKLTTALHRLPQGDPKRLPLVLMHVFATRARVDARDMLLLHSPSEDNIPSNHLFRQRLIQDEIDFVSAEIQIILSPSKPQTPYTIGVLCSPALAHYTLLLKTLTISLQAEPQQEEDQELRKRLHKQQQLSVIGLDGNQSLARGKERLVWDDGLDSLRAVLKSSEGSCCEGEEVVEIAAVSDVLWFLAWRQLQANNAPLGGIPRQVPVSALLASLGCPVSAQIGAGGTGGWVQASEALKRMVLLDFRRGVEEKLGETLTEWLGEGAKIDLCLGESAESRSIVEEILKRQRGLTEDEVAVNSDGETYVEEKGGGRKKYQREAMVGHAKGVNALALGPDGTLYSASQDCTVKQWREGKCLATLEGHVKFVYGLAFGGDGSLFSGSLDGTIKEWREGRCVSTLAASSGVFSLVAAVDGALYAGLKDGTIEKWQGGQRVEALMGHVGAVRALAIGGDGELYSGSHDKTVKEWREDRCVATVQEEFMVHVVVVGRDGSLFTGGAGPGISHWKGGQRIGSFHGTSSWVLGLALGADGSLFSGGGKRIRQWHGGKCRGSLHGHGSNVWSITVDVDGTLYSGGEDGTINRWAFRKE